MSSLPHENLLATLGEVAAAFVGFSLVASPLRPETSLNARPRVLASVAIALTLLVAGDAKALLIFEYQGNGFEVFRDDTPPPGSYAPGDAVSGSFVLPGDQLLPDLDRVDLSNSVLTISFSDGRVTLTEADVRGFTIRISTDSGGNLSGASVGISDISVPVKEGAIHHGILTSNFPGSIKDSAIVSYCPGGPLFCDGPYDEASIEDAAGVWTVTAVPEPAAIALLGLACTARFLAAALRRRSLARAWAGVVAGARSNRLHTTRHPLVVKLRISS